MGIKKQTRRLFKARAKELKATKKLADKGTVTEITPSMPRQGHHYFPQQSNVNLNVAEANQALRTASKGSKGLKVDTRPAQTRDPENTSDGVTE